ncbi:aromatic ring-hydroxylating dioxygenase subunit alpha [Pseudomonas sp.]|uniref:aromatic ring-hydroxylating dioxygenase subunit alpha n=1 Tax=Pseudomonas sp. TaxID=306 RepID=UPI00261B2E2B|nr:aromatic ring-hydroxylating dioxygenase subunit alpha [Pseudomonas sp.]
MNQSLSSQSPPDSFPVDQWYVGGFAWELTDKPLARTLLNQPLVLFRTASGEVAALEDRCCHRALPLSLGTLEGEGLRCGYHGLLFGSDGQCLEIPGQAKVPSKAKVRSFIAQERDQILWIWFGRDELLAPLSEPPAYPIHCSGDYRFAGDVYHYNAPWQLIHDNLLDLSHLGYVHLHTIGGNASIHMNAQMQVSGDEASVRVVRYMFDSEPPPTYSAAYPFKARIDRWQEIEFNLSHLKILTGAVDAGSQPVDDPQRGGFHMRGFHGITPETDTTCHYFWTMATNPISDPEATTRNVIEQTRQTFDEDKLIIEAQFANQQRFGERPMVDIHVDAAPNRARRIVERLRQVDSV